MKILLFGKNGQLGFELLRGLAPLGQIQALGREDFDLSYGVGLPELIKDMAPDVIVNAAAYNAVDKAEEETDLAMDINCHAPALMAEAAREISALLVHFSTDYVFDGEKADRLYDEKDETKPLGVYGRSKLYGEQALQKSGAKYLIFRTSWLVGAHGYNFAKNIINLACKKKSLKVVNDRFGVPTSLALVADITAHAIRQIVQYCDGDAMGLYHLAAEGKTSLHGYARYVVEKAIEAGKQTLLKPDNILPISATEYQTIAKRPLNSLLSTELLRRTFDVEVPNWRSGLDHVLRQIL